MSLKGVVERAAVASGIVGYRRARQTGTLVLAYHNIVPDHHPPGGDQSLHLPRSRFAEQLDELMATCDVVPLETALGPTSARRRGRPRVVITFDDCYAGAVSLGASELNRRGLPATYFVAPGLLEGSTFWWDALADAATGLAPATREHVLTACQGRGDQAAAWAASTGVAWRPQEGPTVSCSAAALDQLTAAGAFTLGCHTWSHPNVERLTPAEVHEELARTAQWLSDRNPAAARPWISWPYGLNDRSAHEAARALGYQAAFRVDGGWMIEGQTGFELPRFNVPAGLSLDGFRIRLAGLLAT